jgi:hypothetical protein
MTHADHELEIVVGNRRGCAPDTVDLISVFAAATDIGLGKAGLGEAAAEGDTPTEGPGDTEAPGFAAPHVAISTPTETAIATDSARFATSRS